jgi:PAS domain S-box-containing protein
MITPDYFNQIFKLSPLPSLVIIPGPAVKVLEANDAYANATGISRTALLGNNLIKILEENLDINIDSLGALRQSFSKILRDKLPHKMAQISFNLFNEDIDNFEIKYFQPENIPLLNEQQEVGYIIHTLTDITEKKWQLDQVQMDAPMTEMVDEGKSNNKISQHIFSRKEKPLVIEETNKVFANADKLYRNKINYESLINGTDDLMWSIDPKMNLITANRAYIERLTTLTGKAPVAGDPVLHAELGVEINETWRAIYQRALQGESFNFKDQEFNAVKQKTEYAQFSFSPIMNRKYEVIGVACYGKDLTQETQSLLTLETVWKELNKIMDYSPDVICTIDNHGKFINVSAAAEKLWGYDKESMIGFNYSDLVAPEDMELTKIAGNQIIEGRVVTNFENRCLRKDGSLVPVIWSAKWDEADRVIYCVAKDGTEKKKAELEMNLLIRNTDESFILLDRELTIVDFNHQFKTLYENLFKLEVKKGISILEYAAPGRQNGLKKLYDKVLGGHEETSEISIPTNDKTKKFYFLKYKPALNEKNEIIGVFVTGKDITETKTLQDLLNKSNRLARIGSWEIDVIKGTVYWSDVTKEIREADADFEPDLSMGMHYFKEGKDRDTIKNRVQECIKNGTPWDEELQILTQKGNLRWVRTIGEPEMANGKCIKIYGSFQDIDEKKRAEIAALRLYEEKNTILESIGDGFFTIDNNWIVSYWNHQAEKMLLTPKNKILGHSLWDIFPYSINSISYKNYHKAIETREVVHFENHYVPLNKWYEVSAYPSSSGLSVYFKDITDRKKSHDAIRLSNELYTMVSKATNDSVWDWDLQTNKVSRPGKTLESLFGYESIAPPDVDQFWKTHVHPDDWKRITEKRNLQLEDPKENYWEDEYRFLKPDGKFALIYDRAYIIRNEQNQAIRMIGASQDFTRLRENEIQLKELNEKLQKRAQELSNSNAELEQFAYIASHDLQEPLRMVTSFLTLLEKKYTDTIDEKGKQYIYFAVDGAKRMRQMILDLLEYSRMGRAGQTKEKIDFNTLLNEILILYRQTIQEKKAIIKINKLPVITASMAPMRQVLQNLVGNALKYNNKEAVVPEISISCRSSKHHWEFSVKDNGIGIDEQYFDKIFVIFSRLHNKEEYSGTGMGLAIAKKIIESMGGKIWLTSELGKGSTFFFTILKEEQKNG